MDQDLKLKLVENWQMVVGAVLIICGFLYNAYLSSQNRKLKKEVASLKTLVENTHLKTEVASLRTMVKSLEKAPATFS